MAANCRNRSKVDLCYYAGDTAETTLQVLIEGDPAPLVGATVTAQARRTVTDPEPALTAACTITDEDDGLVLIAWDTTEMRAVLAGAASWSGVWDVQVVWPSGLVVTPAGGTLIVDLDVTRD